MPLQIVPIFPRHRRKTHRHPARAHTWTLVAAVVAFAAGVYLTASAGPDWQALLGVIAATYLCALAVHAIGTHYDDDGADA